MRFTNYDRIAAAYDERYAEEDYSGIEQALIDFVGPAPGHVVEVGCGTGHWLRLLHERGSSVTGIDLSRPMLVGAQRKLGARFLAQGRAEDLPFQKATCDRVLCINAHHHFANKPNFINEARRVLQPEGSLMTVALDPHTGIDRWWVYDYFDGALEMDLQRYPSCEQLRHWLNSAGFIDVFTKEVQHFPGDTMAANALHNGMVTPSYTSQLAILTHDEFSAGVERINAAITQNGDLRLAADLRVYATYGRVPDEATELGRP